MSTPDLLRDFPWLREHPILGRAHWRAGRAGLPVLTRLPPGVEEGYGDRDSQAEEPDPCSPGLREQMARERDTAGEPHESEWWEDPYRGGGPAKPKGFPRPLYPPGTSGHAASKDGKDVTAYKRTVSRLGRWPWQTFDDTYSKGFAKGTSGNVGESGVAGVQRQSNIQATGNLGQKTYDTLRYALVPEEEGFSHGGEQAMDSVAVNLLDEAWQAQQKPPAGISDVKAAIVDFCRRAIQAAPAWHYEQYRQMRYLGVSPDATHHSDCSEHSTESYYWAKQKTGVAVPDPNHSGYNGYGYTGTQVDNPKVGSPYQVGDLAIYGQSTGSTEHVCTCYEAGDSSSSEWCSHGSEAAPYAVELHYRSDLLCVVRPGLMP